MLDNGGERVSLDTAMDLSIWPAVSADFNDDGVADFRDFLLFAEHFGMDDVRYDLTGDGAVDLVNFVVFATAFSAIPDQHRPQTVDNHSLNHWRYPRSEFHQVINSYREA